MQGIVRALMSGLEMAGHYMNCVEIKPIEWLVIKKGVLYLTGKDLTSFVLLGYILFLFGLVLVFFSTNFGMYLGDRWLISQGGADHETYLFVIEGYAKSVLVVGGIILGVGLTTLILLYYKILKLKLKEEV